jgi:hypothetical protein
MRAGKTQRGQTMSCDFNRVNRGRDECGLTDGKTEAVSWQSSESEKSSWAAKTQIVAAVEVKGQRSYKVECLASVFQKCVFDVGVLGSRMMWSKRP